MKSNGTTNICSPINVQAVALDLANDIKLCLYDVVPMPTLPELSIRIRSVLPPAANLSAPVLVTSIKPLFVVEPLYLKSIPGLPLERSTLINASVPATVKTSLGEFVPIPTRPELSILSRSTELVPRSRALTLWSYSNPAYSAAPA